MKQAQNHLSRIDFGIPKICEYLGEDATTFGLTCTKYKPCLEDEKEAKYNQVFFEYSNAINILRASGVPISDFHSIEINLDSLSSFSKTTLPFIKYGIVACLVQADPDTLPAITQPKDRLGECLKIAEALDKHPSVKKARDEDKVITKLNLIFDRLTKINFSQSIELIEEILPTEEVDPNLFTSVLSLHDAALRHIYDRCKEEGSFMHAAQACSRLTNLQQKKYGHKLNFEKLIPDNIIDIEVKCAFVGKERFLEMISLAKEIFLKYIEHDLANYIYSLTKAYCIVGSVDEATKCLDLSIRTKILINQKLLDSIYIESALRRVIRNSKFGYDKTQVSHIYQMFTYEKLRPLIRKILNIEEQSSVGQKLQDK